MNLPTFTVQTCTAPVLSSIGQKYQGSQGRRGQRDRVKRKHTVEVVLPFKRTTIPPTLTSSSTPTKHSYVMDGVDISIKLIHTIQVTKSHATIMTARRTKITAEVYCKYRVNI